MKQGPVGFLFITLLIFFFTLPLIAADLDGLKVKFGGDGYVRGFSTESNTGSKSQGYAQLLRLKLDLTTKDKISIRTRTVLSGDKWTGDTADQAISGNSSGTLDGGNPVRLDYGYIEAPLPKGWMARAGRQTANFSDCFNTCDDRRDRLMLFKFYGNLMPAVLFDKRTEGTLNKEGDDGDMYAAALFHLHARHEWALLYATWFNDDKSYVLRNVHNFSPYYKYKSPKFTGLIVWNWLGLGDRGSWYHGHHNSGAIKGEYRFHKNFDFSMQGIISEDGGLITAGYDTYSFVVNNDPDNNRSNSRLVRLGGFGTFTGGSNDDEHFIVSRLRYLNGKFKAALAVGRAREFINPTKQDLMIYDMQAHYQYSKSLLLKAGIALVREDRSEEATLFQMETSF
jgi:hypothetical protein